MCAWKKKSAGKHTDLTGLTDLSVLTGLAGLAVLTDLTGLSVLTGLTGRRPCT